MTTARVSGHTYEFDTQSVQSSLDGIDPEPIRDHYVIVLGRRYPPKQVLGLMTGLDRADFTTHQARAVLRRIGLGVYRRSAPPTPGAARSEGPHAGAEAALLAPYQGRWVAQDGLDILFDAEHPEDVLGWLRRHGRSARVWRVPSTPSEVGSTLSAP